MTISLLFFFLILWGPGSRARRLCESQQYLELRRPGTIHCNFHADFYSVFWYNASDYVNHDPVLRYGDLLKSGYGYDSGEYDVSSNGSLIVTNVSLRHEGIYTAAYLHSRSERPVISKIRVDVVVKPDISFPRILNCRSNSEKCYSQVDSTVLCSVQNVRPNLTLKWIAKTFIGDKVLPNNVIATRGTVGYTFLATTTNIFHYSPNIALLACKVFSPVKILQKSESMILVENRAANFSFTNQTRIYVERYSKLQLTCASNAIAFIVWKKATNPDGSELKNLLYSIFIGEIHSELYEDNITVDSNGGLVVLQVDVHHEGIYFCIFGNGLNDGWITYEVNVAVHPVPPYPVVEGCYPGQYCEIEASHEGSLTCMVKGVRPRVELEWKTFLQSEAELISFTNHKSTVQHDGETFYVTQTSMYQLKDKSHDRLTIECRSSGSDKHFYLTTKIDLIFKIDAITKSQEHLPATHNGISWIIAVSVMSVIFCIIGLFGMLIKKKKNRTYVSGRRSADNDESIRLQSLPGKMYGNEAASHLKELFLTQIKEKYKDWYEAVQPIPYIKDRLYCVDKIFVDGGIEFLDSIDGQGGCGEWKTLETYENVFTATQVRSPRRILEGQPGYGKTTVTLQFAYDWCNSKPTSALKDAEILILLRLRQLGGFPSIYKAIKRFILPRDTTISETDIEQILRNSKPVVFILDGFDEYPDQDSTPITDVMTIIARQMFQEVEVLTTTRSSFLPNNYPPLTKRIRLTGFDDKARREYIRKAAVGDDDDGVRKIEGYLKDNPILSDLCQVPLLFVIFAHLTYESEPFRKLNSVTSFFRYMISCFHSHMRNKMDNENVWKYELFETDHRDLDKLAFEAFSGQNQRIVWEKDEMGQLVGQEFYEQYIRIGILVEEERFDISDDPGTPITEHLQYKTEVRFYHKLFCEWYAAHYLTDYLQRNPTLDLDEFLRHLDPLDVQYLYRFACGINPDSAERIIDYLKNIEGCDKFAILCILEQTSKIGNVKETISQLCDEGVVLSGHDTLLLQRSSMQLLEIAARNEIPIDYVDLYNCFQSVELASLSIKTTSGLALTSRIPVKELWVSLFNRDMTGKEAIGILQFASMCPSLRQLGYSGSVPPHSFKVDSILATLKSRNVKVSFRMFKAYPLYILNLETGRWKNQSDGNEQTAAEFVKMGERFSDHLKGVTDVFFKEEVQGMREYLRKLAKEQRDSAE